MADRTLDKLSMSLDSIIAEKRAAAPPKKSKPSGPMKSQRNDRPKFNPAGNNNNNRKRTPHPNADPLKLYIGAFNVSPTDEEVQSLFKPDEDGIVSVNLEKNAKNPELFHLIVDVATEEDSKRIQGYVNGITVPFANRPLKCGPFIERSAPIATPITVIKATTLKNRQIHVFDIPQEFNEANVRQVFRDSGAIDVVNRYQNRWEITFRRPESVDAAVADFNGAIVNGKTIRVVRA